LDDNTALYHALRNCKNIFPIFIFDPDILDKLEDKSDRRVDFIHQALEKINLELHKQKSSLSVFIGKPKEVFESLFESHKISKIYCNHDYEPYANERDNAIRLLTQQNGAEFLSFKDQVIFEKSEITKDDGKPYTIFTPYSVKWKKALTAKDYNSFNTIPFYENFYRQAPKPLPTLNEIGFQKTDLKFSNPAVSNLLLQGYKDQRNFPAINGTSRLSMHLRFGTVSVRKLAAQAMPHSETWLNELIWREFYMMILWHFPYVVTGSFKKNYNRIEWRNNEKEFDMWCKGHTGFPIVDAGMRELNTTGFMHNRVRMIVSSFLVKDLLIDWRWGEAYFAAKLNDFDLSANNGGWQWAAGSGCDAAPYFRIFNPTEQQKKFDPDFKYIKKWIPEFGTPNYPLPMVDHAQARLRTLATYKKALTNDLSLF